MLTENKVRREQISTSVLINKINRGEINLNHPLQRKSGQWKPSSRDGYVASIIKNEDTPNFVICEKIVKGVPIDYLIDGLQRLTIISTYKNDCFRLGKMIEFPIVTFRRVAKDADGKLIIDDNGNPETELVSFDIRGKKYSDLPDELKDIFNNYSFCVVKRYDSTDEEIAYDIRRYNSGRAMTVAQSNMTYLSNGLASKIKKIANSHRFFMDVAFFSKTVRKNGTVEKIVIESLMSSFHLSDWTRNAGRFLSDLNWQPEVETLSKNLIRLTNIVSDESAELFNSKNTFLLIGLFSRFAMEHDEKDDWMFKNFLDALATESIDGVNEWHELNINRGTKDKSTVIKKMECLNTMLHRFLNENSRISIIDGQRIILSDLFVDVLIEDKTPLKTANKCLVNLFGEKESYSYNEISEFIQCGDIINELALNCKNNIFEIDIQTLINFAHKILMTSENISVAIANIATEFDNGNVAVITDRHDVTALNYCA